MSHSFALSHEQLYRHTDANQLKFETTADLPVLSPWELQPRGKAALDFGLHCRKFGQQVYVMGSVGLGKHSLVESVVRKFAESQAAPGDWIYLSNFSRPLQPRVVQLNPGVGMEFEKDIARLVNELLTAIPGGLEMIQFDSRYQSLQNDFQEQAAHVLEAISQDAIDGNVLIDFSGNKALFVAAKNGHPLSQEELHALSEDERARYASVIAKLEGEYSKYQQQQIRKQKTLRQNLILLNQEAVELVLRHFIDELREKYQSYTELKTWLDELTQDLCDHIARVAINITANGANISALENYLEKFQVRPLPHDDQSGVPVICETWPTIERLLGKIDDAASLGLSVGDPRRIRFGSLQRANGGYLIIDAERLLQQPEAWDGLKRALRTGVSSITCGEFAPGQQPATRLEPEPLSLDVKIVLIGDRQLYYKLLENDEEFFALFNVSVDFDEVADIDETGLDKYASWIAAIVKRLEVKPLHRQAVARVIEYSQFQVEDIKKLSLNQADIGLLLSEADYCATESHHPVIERSDIETAIAQQKQRVERLNKRQLEEFQRGSLILDTRGSVVGQVNGLFVIEMGDHSYGQPSRITATVRVGEGEVMDIEREVDLGGPLHSKGVYILSAYLASHYSHNKPLSLAATLVFEQSYSQVDGDSASVAEICALLSALANIPIRQSIAITGSVNQRGQVQPVGGLNEKIESFFEICQSRGLTGEQGVVIPASNRDNLMLSQSLVNAVRENKFNIYAVNNVNEAISVLTGMEAGVVDEAGKFPDGTLNEKVDARLVEFAELRHDFSKTSDDEEHDDEEKQ